MGVERVELQGCAAVLSLNVSPLPEPFYVLLPGGFASRDVEAGEEAVLVQKPIHGHSLLGIALEALPNEVKEFGRPASAGDLGHVHVDDVVRQPRPVSDIGEGGHARSQLMGVAAEGPDIDLLGVANSTRNLG